MDVCDPGLDISNLRTLIKQNTGTELKLSKEQICDVYASIQGGKLPLPPLILSKDGSYLTDRKSPLTRKEFDTFFSSNTKVDDLRKIAKKVGVVRYADKKLSKRQLTDIIGRRLHSMNVHEPIKLRSVQKKQIEKNAFNNSNTNTFQNNLNVNANVNSNVNRINGNINRINGNINRINGNVNRINGNANRINGNANRINTNANRINGNANRINSNVNRINTNSNSNKFKKNNKPRFLNKQNNRTLTNTKPLLPIREFTAPKQKRPAFLNKSFIKTNKIKPMPGYVFKTGNKGLGMYRNNSGPVEGPARGPVEGPKVLENRNREIKENEILLRSYLNRENVSKYINNSEKTNAINRVKRGTKFNNVKTYINGIVSTKITNEQRVQNQKIKLEQNRNELQKILSELTNLTNTNKNEILSKFNSDGKLNNAKTLAIQKDRDIKKRKLENLKYNLTTFLENKNVNNKGTYINRLNAGEDISNLKREIHAVINKKNAEAEYKEEQRRQQRKLLNKIMNNSKHFNNAEKNVFRQRFNSGENFTTLKENASKRAQNLKAERVRKEKELLEEQEKKRIRNEQQRLLSKILNNSKNMTNENKVPFLQRFNKGENFNTVKGNAIRKAQNLKRNRIQKEKNELNRKAKEEENRLAKEEANRLAKEKANQNAKNEANRLAKEKANQNAKNEANREGKESKRLFNEAQEKKEANRLAKEEANKIQREKEREEKRRRLTKILGNSKNLTNEDKAAFLKRFENGENVNTVKANAISKAKELAKLRKNKEETNRLEREKEEAERIAREREEKRLAKEEANRLAKEKAEKKLKEKRQKAMSKLLNSSKNLTNMNKMGYLKRFENGENYNALKQNVVSKIRNLANQRKKKEEEERKAKEEANRLAKEEANKKEREKQQQLLSKILNNSKNLTNANKMAFLKRFEKGDKFNTVKKNVISKAKELAKQRKAKEEEERKAREKEEAKS